jgi:hypothetical protein
LILCPEWVIAISLLLNILKMQKILTHKPKAFSNRGVTVDQAIRILRRNGIQVNEDHARIILDFLYLIAKTMPKSGACYGTIGEIEHRDY